MPSQDVKGGATGLFLLDCVFHAVNPIKIILSTIKATIPMMIIPVTDYDSLRINCSLLFRMVKGLVS